MVYVSLFFHRIIKVLNLYNQCLLVYKPKKPDKTGTDPKSWIALECGAAEKFSATGAHKRDVPFAVYSLFSFMKTELESGWFAIQMVPDDKDDYGKKKLTKVCESRRDCDTY